MLVSFAIVAYNEERSLPQLLHDLENQDYPHNKIEVLLIDSCLLYTSGKVQAPCAVILRDDIVFDTEGDLPCAAASTVF